MGEPNEKQPGQWSLRITAGMATLVAIGGTFLGTAFKSGQNETNDKIGVVNTQMATVNTQMAVISIQLENVGKKLDEQKQESTEWRRDFDLRLRKVENSK